MQKGEGAAAAPTGCFKCGRPGHWSRDCPSSSNPKPNPGPPNSSSNEFKKISAKAEASSAKKVPRSRPKLTPDLLLSDDGLGYVLRHFPRNFKYRGRGHEVDDLGNLIAMYADWHAHVLPYYSFDQFIHKVEQVGASKRVRRCINELKERVARGGDLTKLHETPVEILHPDEAPDQREDDDINVDEPNHGVEEMMNEIYLKAADAQESGHAIGPMPAAAVEPPIESRDGQQRMVHITESADLSFPPPLQESGNAIDPTPAVAVKPPIESRDGQQRKVHTTEAANVQESGHAIGPMPAAAVEPPIESRDGQQRKVHITEEQRARMEANRLKALARAKQARSSRLP
ncbi:hypothetical protein HPP92_025544 [Vanilla planifolia]|uniref:CCHC-type domain-containing protein n=1 Tax=Vanilla planifolia TaxID=51239 RepID=A0A835PN35_VANPL|nr:hypothetical protein HPP92_025841 [Vanilla planifolia]KAG0454240.1 hypothetical protein HPP92_025544 [Vanilla planifolia]